MIGDDGISGLITLSKDGFWRGSTVEKTIKAEKVGNIEMIKLYNEGDQPYLCKRITIEYKTKFWVFDCSNPISKLDNPDVDLVLSGQ